MIKFIKSLLCSHHTLVFIRDIGGDEMTQHYVKGSALAKSEWVCKECGSYIYKNYRVKC